LSRGAAAGAGGKHRPPRQRPPGIEAGGCAPFQALRPGDPGRRRRPGRGAGPRAAHRRASARPPAYRAVCQTLRFCARLLCRRRPARDRACRRHRLRGVASRRGGARDRPSGHASRGAPEIAMSESSFRPVADHGALSPSPWIVRFAHLVAADARVLDLACGNGRHARLFAARGCSVLAVDRDAEAIASLATVSGVKAAALDLESGPWPLAGERFGAIVVTNYLHRPLLPALLGALRENGGLLYETFARGNEAASRTY